MSKMAAKVTMWDTVGKVALKFAFILATLMMVFAFGASYLGEPRNSPMTASVRSIAIEFGILGLLLALLDVFVFRRLVTKHWHAYISAMYQGQICPRNIEIPAVGQQSTTLGKFIDLLSSDDARVLIYEETSGTGCFSLPLMDKRDPLIRRIHRYVFPLDLGRDIVEDAVVGKLLQCIGRRSGKFPIVIKDPYKVIFDDDLENSMPYAGPPVTSII